MLTPLGALPLLGPMRSALLGVLTFTTLTNPLQSQTPETAGELGGQESLDPMVVFGEVSAYQSWPLSASAISGEDLAAANRQNARDLSAVIPNMSQTDTGLRAFGDVASMRGLTNTPFFGNPSVVQYLDDVPMGNVFSYASRFHAVDRAEVFRGAQGWLFGRNPYGGVINVISKTPGDLWQGDLFLNYGSYESFVGDGYVMGPLKENVLYLKLGGSYSQRNGYLDNPTLGTHPDDQEHASGLGTLYWKPGPGWEVRLSAAIDRFDDGAPRLTPLDGDPYTVSSDVHGETRQRADSQALRISYEGDDYRFLSVSSRRHWEMDPYFFDLDLGPFPGNESLIIQEQDLLSQELRLSSLQGGDWEWTLGAYLASMEVQGNTQRDFLAPGPRGVFFPVTTTTDYDLDEDSAALFGQLSYHGIDRWGLHLGLRFDYVEKGIHRDALGLTGPVPTIGDSEDYFHAGPRFAVDYELDESSLLYISTALAFKPGGFSAFIDDPNLAPYDEERSWATEFGWKKSWWDDALQTSAAVFFNEIRDYQVERSLVATDYAVLNAERAQSYGAEVEFRAELPAGFTLEGALGLVNTEFHRFTDPLTGADLSGNKAPFVPEMDASLAAVYRHPNGLFARVGLVHQGETFFDDFNQRAFREAGYTLLNAAVGLEYGNSQLSIFGQNLTEEVYYQNITPDLRAGAVGSPRVVGIRYQHAF